MNTTSDELVCISANQVSLTGSEYRSFARVKSCKLTDEFPELDPTLHGEIAAVNRCTEVLAERGLSPLEILDSWKDLSLYTTGEPCSMVSERYLVFRVSSHSRENCFFSARQLFDGLDSRRLSGPLQSRLS